MRNKVPPEVERYIQQAEERSMEVSQHWEHQAPGDLEWEKWRDPFEAPQGSKIRVSGTGATFNCIGEYKPACAVDHSRFDMSKPQAANAREKKKRQRQAFGADSCAEWELFVAKLFKPGPQKPPTLPPPVARREGMAKSSTYCQRPPLSNQNILPPKSATLDWEPSPGWKPPPGRWEAPPQPRLNHEKWPMPPPPNKKVKTKARACCFF